MGCWSTKAYLEKLVLLPRKEGKPKQARKGRLPDSTEQQELAQNKQKEVIALPRATQPEKGQKIDKDMNEFRAHSQLRQERMNKKWAGKRATKEEKAE